MLLGFITGKDCWREYAAKERSRFCILGMPIDPTSWKSLVVGKKAGAESFAFTVDGLSGVGVSQTCQGKVNLKVKPRTDQSPSSTPLPFGPALHLPRPPLPPPPSHTLPTQQIQHPPSEWPHFRSHDSWFLVTWAASRDAFRVSCKGFSCRMRRREGIKEGLLKERVWGLR